MKQPISITSVSSISPLGSDLESTWEAYLNGQHYLTKKRFGDQKEWVSAIQQEDIQKINEIKNADPKYRSLDKTVLYALFAARKAVSMAGWQLGDDFGINIGSSRGATELFETYHEEFLANGKNSTLSSPTTTLGNISSWLAHDLKTHGPEISHSITCSTGLHAVLNGVAWLQSGMAHKFLVGGSEAPLTPFTISQMKALKVYSRRGLHEEVNFPCLALEMEKKENTMVLGEGASVACLEVGEKKNALAQIVGVGYATEPLKHNISISTDALCFQRSMKMALGDISPSEVDVVVMHAPGTIKGDSSEIKAIKKIFGGNLPLMTTNKWKLGHTFASSGVLSLELAVLMLQEQCLISTPFQTISDVKKLKRIMVNAVGFGGNAVSVLIDKP
ncbi:beta-ketoacyl synthase N-terminal-like domain-containing protein [Euzebyella saccharophila]|uniref:Beta-ketoacyl synthase N-terminal-like domain-containing protein n=1 Tax=Euzebyella saccharophila TaxID=679664 RepID=A0ABV8JPH8_9FLAO|nr:beta-ketoacyl synthase N-terminal-like domain-containing protein [Euzebyella saccharophila]